MPLNYFSNTMIAAGQSGSPGVLGVWLLTLNILVFLLWTLSFWYLGELALNRLTGDTKSRFRFERQILSVSIGMGAIGLALIIAGMLFKAYDKVYIWPLLLILSLFALRRIWVVCEFRQAARDLASAFTQSGAQSKTIYLIILACISLWFAYSMNFPTGSDVRYSHYLQVKTFIDEQSFTHDKKLPFGMDSTPNYNPQLAHIVFLAGAILGDVRAANMFYFLSLILLLGFIYCLCRYLYSLEAAVFAVLIFLSYRTMAFLPPDPSDYPMMALYLLGSVYLMFVYNKSRNPGYFYLAAAMAGFMLNSKLYGVVVIFPLALTAGYLYGEGFKSRLKGLLVFSSISLAMLAPWLVFNVINYGDPLYPFLAGAIFGDKQAAFRLIEVLDPFISPTETGLSWPIAKYYLSFFIPFEPSYQAFGLNVLPLLFLPISIYLLLKGEGEKAKPANILFLLSVAVFIVVEAAAGGKSFYKHHLFFAGLYTASIAGAWTYAGSKKKTALWFLTLFVAVNTIPTAWHMRGHAMIRLDERIYWNDKIHALDEIPKDGSVYFLQNSYDAYYLKGRMKIVTSATEAMLSNDWDAELELLEELGVKYYVDDSWFDKRIIIGYALNIDTLKNLGFPENARQTKILLEDFKKRTGEKYTFLKTSAKINKILENGVTIYELP